MNPKQIAERLLSEQVWAEEQNVFSLLSGDEYRDHPMMNPEVRTVTNKIKVAFDEMLARLSEVALEHPNVGMGDTASHEAMAVYFAGLNY